MEMRVVQLWPCLPPPPLPQRFHTHFKTSPCCKRQDFTGLWKAPHVAEEGARKEIYRLSFEDDDDLDSSNSKDVEEEEEEEEEEASKACVVAALKACAKQDVAAFHFPGHRRGAAAPSLLSSLVGKALFAHDLPELPELDNLFAAEGVIADAQARAATLFGAGATHFLVNGSTCGIQAAVLATCSPGDVLILPRNSHISAISALILSGASPKFLVPSYDPHWDVAHGIDPLDVDKTIHKVRNEGGRTVGAVFITSPTYFGVCSNVREIANICHKNGVPLIVDEAHGAHFYFHPNFPESALEQGADIAVQSTHKVLCSLTQSGMLHVNGSKVNREMLKRCLQLLQSSSPSYLLLASLDAARAQINSSNAPFHEPLKLALAARKALKGIPGLDVLEIENLKETNAQGSVALDPLRITIGLWGLGLSGFEADEILRTKHLVVVELPSLRSITLAFNLGTSRNDVQQLVKSLQSLSNYRLTLSREQLLRIGAPLMVFQGRIFSQIVALTPREAFFTLTERVQTKYAEGLICAELVCPYPPGIPVLVPGEIISKEALIYLREIIQKGGIVSGASDASLDSLLICKLT